MYTKIELWRNVQVNFKFNWSIPQFVCSRYSSLGTSLFYSQWLAWSFGKTEYYGRLKFCHWVQLGRVVLSLWSSKIKILIFFFVCALLLKSWPLDLDAYRLRKKSFTLNRLGYRTRNIWSSINIFIFCDIFWALCAKVCFLFMIKIERAGR